MCRAIECYAKGFYGVVLEAESDVGVAGGGDADVSVAEELTAKVTATWG
ncbi:hypothetical protein ACFU5O_01320 [Streptomyces sp. NPDC057445]